MLLWLEAHWWSSHSPSVIFLVWEHCHQKGDTIYQCNSPLTESNCRAEQMPQEINIVQLNLQHCCQSLWYCCPCPAAPALERLPHHHLHLGYPHCQWHVLHSWLSSCMTWGFIGQCCYYKPIWGIKEDSPQESFLCLWHIEFQVARPLVKLLGDHGNKLRLKLFMAVKYKGISKGSKMQRIKLAGHVLYTHIHMNLHGSLTLQSGVVRPSFLLCDVSKEY